ncbi:YxeA family protein [Enterococcus sp. DIV0800]|uniref:YxeA family protein n=1 Tax=unclassified Enterococcus TaxID=2608891 RepID=UPI003D2FD735
MKRLISLLVFLVIVGGSSWYLYQQNFGSRDLYTKVIHDGRRVSEGKDKYGEVIHYKYKLPSFDEKNVKHTITFKSVGNKKIRKNAYLLIHYNNKKGVLGWEEIKSTDIPKPILNSLIR